MKLPSRASVLRLFTEFRTDRNSLMGDQHTGRALSAIV